MEQIYMFLNTSVDSQPVWQTKPYFEKNETRYKVARPSKLFSKPKSRKLVSYSTKSNLNI